MNLTSKRRIEQVRQRWWVVLLVVVLAVLAAGIHSLRAHPTYVGKSDLILTGRTPEQDATVVLGYLTIFNDPATVNRLKAEGKIPPGVTFEALTAAASPILTIEATAKDPSVAQDAAQMMAETFREDLNQVQRTGNEEYIAGLQQQLDRTPPLLPNGSMNEYYTDLLKRIDEAKADSLNQLRFLQPRAGVIEKAPSVMFNVMAAAIGGLVAGILAAVASATFSRRLASPGELQDKTGVVALTALPDFRSAALAGLREDRLRSLANRVLPQHVSPDGGHRSTVNESVVIVMTDSRGARGARDLAEALAELSAQQGFRTVLIYADNDPSGPADGTGFNEALADKSRARGALQNGDVELLKIMPAGSALPDRYSLVTRARIAAVLDELQPDTDTIIVAAPPITDTSETELLCAAADGTILVVMKGSSSAGDVRSAAEAIEQARAVLLGAVLIDGKVSELRGSPPMRSQDPRRESQAETEPQDEPRFAGSGQQPATDYS